MLMRNWCAISLSCLLLLLHCTNANVQYEIKYHGFKYIEVIVNEKFYNQSEEWKDLHTMKVNEVPKIVALIGERIGGHGGLLVQIESDPPVVTNDQWKCTKAELVDPETWFKADFDDSSWPPANMVNIKDKDWKSNFRFPNTSMDATWIWDYKASSEIYCRSPSLAQLDENGINHAGEWDGPPWMRPPWIRRRRGRGRGRGKRGRGRLNGRGNRGRFGFKKRGRMSRHALKRQARKKKLLLKKQRRARLMRERKLRGQGRHRNRRPVRPLRNKHPVRPLRGPHGPPTGPPKHNVGHKKPVHKAHPKIPAGAAVTAGRGDRAGPGDPEGRGGPQGRGGPEGPFGPEGRGGPEGPGGPDGPDARFEDPDRRGGPPPWENRGEMGGGFGGGAPDWQMGGGFDMFGFK